MKKTLGALALSLTLVMAPAATAAFDTGTYFGKNSHNQTMSLKVTKTTVTDQRIGAKFRCSDGESFTDTARLLAQKLTSTGLYDAKFSSDRGAVTYTHKGKVTRKRVNGKVVSRATGTFTAIARFNSSDTLDPEGTIYCRTGAVTYSIKKFF